MESPSFLRPRPKMSQHTERNIEKGIESDNYPKRSGKLCTQKTYTAWRNITMSMRAMPTKTVLTKFMYIKITLSILALLWWRSGMIRDQNDSS